MRIFTSPKAEFNFGAEVEQKAARLLSQADRGGKYALISCDDPLDAITWIIASFYSPVIAVPFSNKTPNREMLLSRLFEKAFFVEKTKFEKRPNFELKQKPLEETWAIIFTSGSTGSPKAVSFSGQVLKDAANAHKEHLGFTGLWLQTMPIFHVGGLNVITRAFFNKDSIGVVGEKFDEEKIWAWISSGAVNGVSLVPTMLLRLLKYQGVPHKNLHVALLGGAPSSDQLVDAAILRGFPIHKTYGMTETCSQIATEKQPRAGMVPLPGTTIKIAADDEIFVSSVATNGKYLPTGDLGSFDKTIKIFGRKSELMISGGVNIYPQEIEQLFHDHPSVLDIAVASIKDDEWGERICVAYVTKEPMAAEALKSFLYERLDRRKIPKHWLKTNEIPRTPTGKVNRVELRNIFEKNFSNH